MGTWVTTGQTREDVQHMKMMRKAALSLAAAVLGVGAVGISAPAHADTNWPCSACFRVGR
jgi:NhaP-type Na+/H+ or K+/H+ antiporter